MASTEIVTAALAQSTLSEVGDPAAKAKKGRSRSRRKRQQAKKTAMQNEMVIESFRFLDLPRGKSHEVKHCKKTNCSKKFRGSFTATVFDVLYQFSLECAITAAVPITESGWPAARDTRNTPSFSTIGKDAAIPFREPAQWIS
jgi:hypothetical protein